MNPLILSLTVSLSWLAGNEPLDPLLREHFLAKTAEKREQIQDQILKTPGLTPKKLGKAIQTVQLWHPIPSGEQKLDLRLRKGKSSEKEVWVSVPSGYTPDKKWPLIITLHGQDSQAQEILHYTLRLLGKQRDEFIVAAPQDLGPLGFSDPTHIVEQPRNLLFALRRTFRIDNDRVYLMGYSLGGHNTWLGAIMHADCFAAAMPLTTPMQVVGDDLLYEEILPNTASLPILFCWGEKDNLDDEGNPHLTGGTAAAARILARTAESVGLKRFRGVEIEGAGHLDVVPPDRFFKRLLSFKRKHFPRHIRQVFRLPDQSDAYWLAADRLTGAPLPAERVHVTYTQGEDPREVARNFLADSLGMIDARCKGQTIKLNVRRCGNVILLLNDDFIDLDQTITILRSDKKRFEGKIKRDMRVMLIEAEREWDFDRLYTARVVIPVGGKTKLGYPEKRDTTKRK